DEILRALETVSRGEKYFSSRLGSCFYKLLSPRRTSVEPPNAACISDREMQVARLVAEGNTNKQVGHLLGCSENTIKSHKANIMRKIGARNSAEIGAWVVRRTSGA